MALSASRLNNARYASILADLQAQFPPVEGLLAEEAARCVEQQEKFAHAIADHDGTDHVEEITAHAVVPAGQTVTTPDTISGTVTSPGTVT
jgi:hypothetical protein